MATKAEPDDRARPTTLGRLEDALGRPFAPEVDRLWLLASATGTPRTWKGGPEQPSLERASVLWAGLRTDPEVARAVQPARLEAQLLAKVSGIEDVDESALRPLPVDRRAGLTVAPALATALARYRNTLPPDAPMRVVDVVLALLESVLREVDGSAAAEEMRGDLLLAQLSDIDVDLFAAADALRALGERSTREATEVADERPQTQTRPSSDEPARVDLLGRKALAEAMLAYIDDIGEEDDASFLLHLDAPWGEGKSSVLGFVADLAQDRYVVVQVNAWREQRVGAQWWTLYSELRRAVAAGQRGWGARARTTSHDLLDLMLVRRGRVWPALITTLLVVGGLGLALTWLDLGQDGSGLGLVTSVLSIVAVVFAAVTGLYRFLAPTSAKDARALVDASDNPMAEVSQLFARSLRRSPRPVLFLIDDLDRCAPAYVVRFLEDVHTLVRDSAREARAVAGRGPGRGTAPRRGPYAVVAADGAWLRHSFEKQFPEMASEQSPGTPLGYAFLDKIFQMHVRLPGIEPGLKEGYFTSLLLRDEGVAPTTQDDETRAREIRTRVEGVTGIEQAAALNREIARVDDPVLRSELRRDVVREFVKPESQSARVHELSRFAGLLDANPRTIRLFVNSVSLQVTTRLIEGKPVALGPVALWAVTERRWPALADHLRRHPDDVTFAQDTRAEPPQTLPPELAALMRRPEVRAVLVSSEWGPLDAARIRDCTGSA